MTWMLFFFLAWFVCWPVLYHKVACKVTINMASATSSTAPSDSSAREQGGANNHAGNVEYVSFGCALGKGFSIKREFGGLNRFKILVFFRFCSCKNDLQSHHPRYPLTLMPLRNNLNMIPTLLWYELYIKKMASISTNWFKSSRWEF